MTYTALPASDKDTAAIVVDDVTMIFNMASENMHNLKEYFIKLLKRELFFKEFKALKNVSFSVKRGEVVGFIGTNGSGKSTMLKIIAGVLEPSLGNVTVRGNISPLIELGAGFDYELTARENIYLNGALLGYSKDFIDEHFDEIIDFAELHDFVDMPLKNYSSGMVARIAFSVATITEPDLLIVDETLSVGDVFFQRKCEERIQRFIKNGDVTVLFVSHSIEQVERICDRAIWIEKGELRMDAPVEEVCGEYRSQFKDITGDTPFAEAIRWLVKFGITRGYADGTFRPSEELIRADTAAFISRLYRVLGGKEDDFESEVELADITAKETHAEAIYWAVENALILPFAQEYRPTQKVTHAEFAQILRALCRLLEQEKARTLAVNQKSENTECTAIDWLKEARLLTSAEAAQWFIADQPISRGETAEMIFRLASLIKTEWNNKLRKL